MLISTSDLRSSPYRILGTKVADKTRFNAAGTSFRSARISATSSIAFESGMKDADVDYGSMRCVCTTCDVTEDDGQSADRD